MALIVLKALRILLLCLSCYGYLYFLVDKGKMKVEFSPAILFSVIGSAVFFAGILNILKEACLAIFAVGVVLAVYSFVKRFNPLRFLCPGMIFFFLCLGYLCFFYYGCKLREYDDFTHWGLVVRSLLQTDRFPNFMDTIIYKSYPTGSAAFIYFVCRISGISSEWMMLLAQAAFMIGCIMCLFAFVKHNVTGFLMITVFSAAVLGSYRFVLSGLYVDVLLPLVGLAGILIGIYYDADINRVLWAILPETVFLIAVKNSGLFFVVITVIYVLFRIKWKTVKKAWAVAFVSAPFLTLLLWQKHVGLVFDQGLSSKHTMSVHGLKEAFLDKKPEAISDIFDKYISVAFDLKNIFLYFLILAIIVLVVSYFLQRQSFGMMGRLVGLCVVSYVLYQCSLLGMYLSSMPVEEAVRLASYDRYHLTIMVFIVGILLAGILSMQFERRWISAVMLVVVSAVNLFTFSPKLSHLQKQPLNLEARQKLEELIEAYQIPQGSSFVLFSEDDFAYSGYVCGYLLNRYSMHLYAGDPTGRAACNINKYDYIIVTAPTEKTEAYIKEVLKIDEVSQVIPLKK